MKKLTEDMKKNYFVIAALVAIGGLTSCSSKEDINQQDAGIVKEEAEKGVIPSYKDYSSEELKGIGINQQQFPIELLSKTYDIADEKNVSLSPLSASMALGMMTNALEDYDRAEVLQALNIKDDELELFNAYNEKILSTAAEIGPNSTLYINNGTWFKNLAELSSDYKNTLINRYNAEIFRYNVFNMGTLDHVNNWVKENTKGKIPSLLNPDDASEDINAVWVNTLYFKSLWKEEFDSKYSSQDSFYSTGTDFKEIGQTAFMSSSGFGYYNYYLPKGVEDKYNNYIKTVALPYNNESYCFLAVMPSDNNYDIEATINALDADYWKDIDEMLNEGKTDEDIMVKLPKFKVDQETDLIPVLKEMGVKKIFATVSMESALGLLNQYIAIIRQKVDFEINEEGSEMAAGTVIVDMDGASDYNPPHFIFNRPFIYFIKEKETGAVLLAGVYSHP